MGQSKIRSMVLDSVSCCKNEKYAMILSYEELRYFLLEDLKRFGGRKPTVTDWVLHNESWYIFAYIRHLRYVEYYLNCYGRKHPLFIWHFFRYKCLGFKLRITIYPNTIGPGLRIYHVGDFIHVGANVKIGRHCTLLPGVVFGNKNEYSSEALVTVGDNCYFGLGVKLFGSLEIGNNVTIGANAVVTKNVPDNAVVGGVPAKIICIKY